MNKTWQAAIAERDKKAHELFEERFKTKGLNPLCFKSNKEAEESLVSDMGFSLKPIDQLIELDIERYGRDNAKFLYEVMLCGKFVQCDYLPIEKIEKPEYWRRKSYANAQFNLEWAKAGVSLECKNDDLVTWDSCVFLEMDKFENVYVLIENKNHVYHPDDLRHPFPPVKELGL